MKSVDLQTSVPRSAEVGRNLRIQNGHEQAQAQELAAGLKRAVERATRTVKHPGPVKEGRVERRREGAGHRQHREQRDRQAKPERDKGNLLDVILD